MANVVHSTLSGADLHEPKGIGSAAVSTVYIADGVGSGAWGSAASLLSITGMIADFALPTPPAGWLECDGSIPLRATYPGLFSAITIQQTGSRTNSSAIITGLTSTTNMRAGYYVSGTGLPLGGVILSVDSPTQITLNGNAGSTGSGTVVVGPWQLGDGSTTFNLPAFTSVGRFRRSRSSSIPVGTIQAELVGPHGHTASASGSTDTGGAHTHGATDAGHVHNVHNAAVITQAGGGASPVGSLGGGANVGASDTGFASITVDTVGSTHSHSLSSTNSTITVNATTTLENRPASVVVLTCIKT